MTDAQTDREHLQAMVAASTRPFPGTAQGQVAWLEGLDERAAAAKQHLDTTKPDDGGAAEIHDLIYQWNDQANAAEELGEDDGAAVLLKCANDLAAAIATTPNEAEIRADERRRIDGLAWSVAEGQGFTASIFEDDPYELVQLTDDDTGDVFNGATLTEALEAATTPSPNEAEPESPTGWAGDLVRGTNEYKIGFKEGQQSNDQEAEIRADERRRIDELAAGLGTFVVSPTQTIKTVEELDGPFRADSYSIYDDSNQCDGVGRLLAEGDTPTQALEAATTEPTNPTTGGESK